MLTICRAPNLGVTRAILRCPAEPCRTRRRHAITNHGPYYGSERVCCHCGFTAEGGYVRRLTKRQRIAAAQQARTDWTNAMTKSQQFAVFKEYLDK